MAVTDISDGSRVQELQGHLETFLKENCEYHIEIESSVEWLVDRKWAIHLYVTMEVEDEEYEFSNQMILNYDIDGAEEDDPEEVAYFYGDVLLNHWLEMIEDGVSFNPLDDQELEDEVGDNPIN